MGAGVQCWVEGTAEEVVMSTNQQRRREGWVLMQAHRLGLRPGPLRRRVDRVEAALRLGALVIALLMIPVAVVLGTAVRADNERAAAERRAELQQVNAQVLEDAFVGTVVVPGQGELADPGRLPGRTGRRASGHRRWPDRHQGGCGRGDLAGPIRQHRPPPPRPGDSTALGVSAGLTTVMVSCAAAGRTLRPGPETVGPAPRR